MRRSLQLAAVAAVALAASCSSSKSGDPAPRGTVSAPTFSPGDPLRFATPLEVALATTTAGATIRYTTDGSAPTDASPAYTAPVTITTTTTFRAFATAAGMDPSPVASVTYTYRVVSLQLEDGIRGTDATGDVAESLWLNRFTPAAEDLPFQVRDLRIGLGPSWQDASIRVVVYTDADGDPSNGATLEAVYDVSVTNDASGGWGDVPSWSVYAPAAPVTVRGPGDVLIGLVSPADPAWAALGWPGSTTSPSGRTWLARWQDPVPAPPLLPSDRDMQAVGMDAFIRGSNQVPPWPAGYGIQQDLDVAALEEGGWRVCHEDRYSDPIYLDTLLAGCGGTYMMLGCKLDPASGTLSLAAADTRAVVLQPDPAASDAYHRSGSVGWYFSEGFSWGFFPADTGVIRNNCDSHAATDPLRLCWELAASPPGFRCGARTFAYDRPTGRLVLVR